MSETIIRRYMPHVETCEINLNLKHRKDLILSFATEQYNAYGKGKGVFNPTWNIDSRNVERMKTIKEAGNPNLRLIISMGGLCSEFPFDPIEKDEWTNNAVESIKHIIDLYGNSRSGKSIINGIDIHYEAIYSTEDDFSFYIGKVIRQLKHDRPHSIKVVSIAPTKPLETYYKKLYFDNKDIIDMVDYHFSKQTFSTKQEVVKFYENLVVDYTPALVLPGVNSPIDPILEDGINNLSDLKLIPGIVYWDSEDSIDAPKTSSLEKVKQNLRSFTLS